MNKPLVLASALLLSIAACAPDLRPDAAAPADAADSPTGPFVQTTREGSVYVSRVDATSSERWIHLDFDRVISAPGDSGEVSPSPGWDVAVQRFKVMSNSGVSGTGGVGVARVEGSFESVSAVPASPLWLHDEPDGDDGNMDPDFAFARGDNWFSYDEMFHTLTPRDVVFVVRTTEGRFVKVKILGYYDESGTGGYMRFQWAELQGGSGTEAGPSDAGTGEAGAGEAGAADASAVD